mgnify:CR=1 FL=1
MSESNESTTPGRLYRVGKDWYVDSALLGRIAGRLVVEPMGGGYQILAPAGLVRCMPAHGLALPGQTGELYRCQGQRPEQDVGGRLRNLAGGLGEHSLGGEWEEWPGEPAKKSCGCHTCGAGTPSKDLSPSLHGTLAERILVSETLGTVAARTLPDGQVELVRANHAAPEWACGRYHECIGSILRFPDLDPSDWIARARFRAGRVDIAWGAVLDRQRHTMLTEILELVARQLGTSERSKSVVPSLPPPTTPGYGAWEMAADLAERQGTCSACPYRHGSNLRCRTCRDFLLADERCPTPDQARAAAKVLSEQTDLRSLPYETLRSLSHAIATSHAKNPNEPLTDAFFVRLERDMLIAARPLKLSEPTIQALLETAELTPFIREIAVGPAARRAA